uniref:DNA methyltransferase n=1 Tax=Eubacterium sp. TaxID=142586 RepID=UPI003FEF9B7C
MANLSQIRRKKMLEFLETLKEQHTDDASLIAINQIERELTAKKYGLVWEEHEEEVDVKMQTHIPVFTEVEDKEIVGDSENKQYNFLLEGDNLHSLKLLEKTYKGKIDVIYIDPPYNTGHKDFVYDDAFVDRQDGYSHSKWISFMEKRLRIAHALLKPAGTIFISIDDNEYANLKLLCDEIFGEESM